MRGLSVEATMTFVLDATNKAIKFTITAGAGADVHFTSHWADATASGLTEGQTQGTSNGSTSVDAVPAPAASTRRVVKLITFHNTSATTSRTVTLVNDVGGTSRTIAVFTLAPLATWYSDTAATTTVIDRDYGDITVSGSGATWTIDNSAVTLAKIANITSGSLLGRTEAGLGPVQEIIPGSGVLTWLQTPTADNLRSAVTGDTGTGDLVFANSPTITSPTVSSGNLTFSGSAQRISGVFNYAAQFSDNTIFQSLASEKATILNVVANTATNLNAGIRFASNPSGGINGNSGQFLLVTGSEFRINSFSEGSGTTRPIRFMTNTVTRLHIENNGNIGINGNSYGESSVGVIGIANATTVPTGNPTNGGVLYVEEGALKYRGSGGKVTILGEASEV